MKGCYLCDRRLDAPPDDLCRSCRTAVVRKFGILTSGSLERWIASRVWSCAGKVLGSDRKRLERPKVLARYADEKDKLSVVLVWSDSRFRWVQGHFSVMLAPCPKCSAPTGTPCYGVAGTTTGTHYVRKHKARAKRFALLRAGRA